MGDTRTDLVKDLEQKDASPKRDELIEKARSGRYHDFDSELVAPKVACARDLQEAGYSDLVEKVINGDYDDESPTVEQEEDLRHSLGPTLFDMIMGKPSRPEN